MGDAWVAPGRHTVQFYDDEPFIHRAIAQFFTVGTRPRDPLILLSRSRTFAGVAALLASGEYGPAIDADDCVQFFDVDAALSQILQGGSLNLAYAERFFTDLVVQARSSRADGAIRIYGEMGDLLCQRGHHAAALQLEGVAHPLFDLDPRLSILCGYAIGSFRECANAAELRAVCQKHTHVIPVESFTHAQDDRDEPEASLQQGAANHGSAVQPCSGLQLSTGTLPAVYVIDDEASIRRSLDRLLALSNFSVRTFDSAKAFLAARSALSYGCLVLDIQLLGMSGLDLQVQLAELRSSWPIIAMSGSDDAKAEREALRLGAQTFLRKPFDPQALLDAIAGALA